VSYLDELGVQAAYKFLDDRWPDQDIKPSEIDEYMDMLRTLHPHELRPALCMIAVTAFGEELRPPSDMIYDQVLELRDAYSQELLRAQADAKRRIEAVREQQDDVPRPAKPSELARPDHVTDVARTAREAIERARQKAQGNIDKSKEQE
jgi:hypothetical protein